MVLYALYVCLLHSRFIENHPIDLEAMNPSFFRWFYHREKPVVSGGGARQEEGVVGLTERRCVNGVAVWRRWDPMDGEWLRRVLQHQRGG
jgi:hypothetical protein